MTDNFRIVLKLFASCATGSSFTDDLSLCDKEKLFEIAESQGIFTFVYAKLSELGIMDVSEFDRRFLALISANIQRLTCIDRILMSMENKGIGYCVLKGETIADVYAQPNLRISSDVDIYVGYENERRACDELKQNGFFVHHRVKSSNHTICTHPRYGIVEVHNALYNDLYENIWFKGLFSITEPYRDCCSPAGLTIKAMGITDGFIYLTLHTVKHFLCEGVGIRQIMDFLLYSSKHKYGIDWIRFWDIMDKLSYTKLIYHMYGIGMEFFGFDDEEYGCGRDVEYEASVIEEILSQCEESGLFGKNGEGLEKFHLTLTKKAYGDEIDVEGYLNKRARRNIFGMAFKNLERFSYYRRCRLLLPVAAIHRALLFVLAVLKGKKKIGSKVLRTDSKESAKETKKMDLLKKINIAADKKE